MIKFLYNSSIPRNAWSSFVSMHPGGTIFQTPEMFDVYEKTSNVKPIAIAAFEGEVIKGVILAAIMTNGGAHLKIMTARSIITGGPLVENDSAALSKVLLQEYGKVLPRYVIYSEIRPVFAPIVFNDAYEQLGFYRSGHYNLTIDTRLEKVQLWEKMHRLRRRNIVKAQKSGLQFREVLVEDDLLEARDIIIQTYRRKRIPMSYADVLSGVKTVLGNHVRYFAAYLDNKMIACLVVLCYKELLYLWFNGSDEAYIKNVYANDFLHWNVLCLAHDEGFSTCDFGGGGEPGVPYGVREYKLKFGCRIYDYGRFVCVNRPILYRIGKAAIAIFTKK